MFEEQVQWAVDAGVDFVIGETFSWGAEALIALDVVKKAGQTAVITLAMHQADVTREGWTRRRHVQAARPTPAPTSSASTASAARRR